MRVPPAFLALIMACAPFVAPAQNLDDITRAGAAWDLGDYSAAAPIFHRLADQGYAVAMSRLGYMYMHGLGVPLSEQRAAEWYRKAGESGSVVGMVNLGWAYEHGRGVPQDHSQALYWYRKVADRGNGQGMSYLGVMYQNGRGVKQDYEAALGWFRKAAEHGDASGMYDLGWMYLNGFGVPRDYDKAADWFWEAAEKGYGRAMADLGSLYESGRGVPRDYEQAVAWFSKAAEHGVANGMANLGLMYESGQGVAADGAEAAQWYRKAIEAEPNNASALHSLGRLLTEGGERLDEAYRLLKKATDLAPREGRYLATMGWVCLRQSKLTEAEGFLVRAVQRLGQDPLSHDRLGDVYYQSGRVREAVQQWEASLSGYRTGGAKADNLAKVERKLENARGLLSADAGATQLQ